MCGIVRLGLCASPLILAWQDGSLRKVREVQKLKSWRIQYSYIEVNKEWLEFNDATVKPFDVQCLEAECYGGKKSKSVFNAQLKRMVLSEQDIQKNAYMLVYIREERVGEGGADITMRKRKEE